VDPEAFRKFCEKNPQLVRRLRTKLNCSTPQSVVDFLRENEKIPTRYKNDTDIADAAEQFPLVPPPFPGAGNDEYNPGKPMDDTFDPFHAARAWFTYAQVVLPPPKRMTDPKTGLETGYPIPWAAPRPGEYDSFKYRVPRSPALIIFRQLPARSQTYLAERLSKEGWFDETSTWDPDEWAGTTNQWFPRSADGQSVRLKAGSHSRNEWEKAWDLWTRYGEEDAQILPPGRREQLLDAAGLTASPTSLPPELSQDELDRRGWTKQKLEAWMALVYYEQNRSITNFPYFVESTRAEKDPLTVEARKLLWQAEEARRYGRQVQAARLYPYALARWREVLATFPQFHRPGSSESTEEATYEHELELIRLLREDGRVRDRAEQTAQAYLVFFPPLRTPFTYELLKADVLQAVAEDEAAARITAESVARVFPRLPLPGTAPEKAIVRRVEERTMAAADGLAAVVSTAAVADGRAADAARSEVVRAVIDTEFAWMKEFKYEPKERDAFGRLDQLAYWVSPGVRDGVKSRLGLLRRPPAAEAAGLENTLAPAGVGPSPPPKVEPSTIK
jgi:hypothetical protein